MSRNMPDQCPDCRSSNIRRHCDSPTCDWWRCRHCRAYGDQTRIAHGQDQAA